MLCCAARATAFILHALLNSCHQARLDSLGNGLAFHPFKDAKSFLRRIANHETIRAFTDVPVEFGHLLGAKSFLKVAVKLLQELLTGKQTRRLPFS